MLWRDRSDGIILNDNDVEWFVAVYENKVIGQCSVGFEITGTIPKALRYQDGTYADEYVMIKSI